MMQMRSIEAPSTSVGLVEWLLDSQNPSKFASRLKMSCPSLVRKRSLLVIINLITDLFTIILLIVVAWDESNTVKFGSAEINTGPSFSIGSVFNSDNDAIAFPMVAEILGSGLRKVCSFTVINVVWFQTLRNCTGFFVSVNSAEINLFWPIEGQVETVVFTDPIDSWKDSVISRSEVDFKVKISSIDAVVWISKIVLALMYSTLPSSLFLWRIMVAGE